MTAVAHSANTSPPAVELVNISHRFANVVALDNVSLEVASGEFVTLLGASGSGKTTLLRIIAGLTMPSIGRVFIAGKDVSATPTQRRGVGFVFQNYALFPHLSVFENIAYPLRIRGIKAPELALRVRQALARVNLESLGQRQPAQLSGGQQQRVAVARALVYEPAVLLMDEPLGALDRKLRKHMQVELRQLQQDLRISCVYVTHDQEEALTMSDRIAVMQNGHVHQIGDPTTVYRHPVNSFVADFVGSTNLFTCAVQLQAGGDTVLVTERGARLAIPSAESMAGITRCHVSVRPEFVRIDEPQPSDLHFAARITKITFVGNVLEVSCTLENGDMINAEVAGKRKGAMRVGDRVTIGWDAADMGVFPMN